MTTAARPTFQPARGGTGKNETSLSSISKQYSSKDIPGQTRLKYRQVGQNSAAELNVGGFGEALKERERDHYSESSGGKAAGRTPYRTQRSFVDSEAPTSTTSKSKKASTNISTASDESRQRSKRAKTTGVQNPDADDPFDSDVEDETAPKKKSDDADSDEDRESDADDADADDDEDDTAELMAELQRIKQERAVEEARRDADRQMKEDRIRNETLLTSNPLLGSIRSTTGPTDLRVKRRWDEDVIFKNCAKPTDADGRKPRYINDSIRSDFHRRFMEKFIK